MKCPCGHAFAGNDDEELLLLAKQHVREHHPDSTRSEEEIRQLVTAVEKDA